MTLGYRRMLFSRIVPTVKDLGLWGPKVRAAFEDMGVMGFQDLVPEEMLAADEALAQDFDARRAAETGTTALAGVDPARAAEVQAAIELGAEG